MVQTIAIAVLLLGLLLLLIGIWGRGWRKGGVYFLQPGTRLSIMLVAVLLIFGGYWFYFDSPAVGRRSDARVWTSSGAENRAVQGDAAAVVSAESEVPVQPALDASPDSGDLARQAEQAQIEQAAAPEAPVASALPSAAEASAEPATTAAAAATPVEQAPSREPADTAATSAVTEKAPPAVPREPTRPASAESAPTKAAAPVRRARSRHRHDDGTVDVCAVQVQYGVVPAVHGTKTAYSAAGSGTGGATRLVTIRNSLGPGQRSEKLRLLIEGREVAKLDVSRNRPSVSVKLKVPRDREVSYSLVGHTDYPGYSRKPVSGGGLLLAHERSYDVRIADPWDIRGGDLFLEPES